MKQLPLASTLAAIVVLFHAPAPAGAQDTRTESRGSQPHWTLVAPVIGRPCPSHLVCVGSKELTLGAFPLSKSLPAIVDGDTIRVESLKESLRLVGLDAEETFKDAGKRKLAETDWNEYVRTELSAGTPEHPPKYATFMGEAAKDAMRQLLEGVTEVRLEWDDPERKLDTYGRHLVFVLFQRDGTWINLNVEIVRQGLSPYFIKYGRAHRMDDLFEAAQKEAKAHERGIWSDRAKFKHYGDYPARLRWWRERAEAIEAAEAARADRKDLFLLGRNDDWERLKTMEGKKVTVFGAIGAAIPKGDRVLLPFFHHKGIDFMVVGSPGEIMRLNPKKEDGNLLYVTGVVEIYKGLPQFQAATVSWSRQPRVRAESVPVSR